MRRWHILLVGTSTLLLLGLIGSALKIRDALALPHPDQANQTQLLRWLVLRDVEKEPESLQLALVNRLTEEAKADSWRTDEDEKIELSERQMDQLVENAEVLKRLWFRDRIGRYSDLSKEQRFGYLEEQIDTIDLWSQIVSLYAERIGLETESAEDLFQQIDRWVSETEGEQRRKSQLALKDGVVCWLSTRDLGSQSMATRRSLATRIASELDRGLKISSVSGVLTPDQVEQLTDNSELLMEAWVYEQLDSFRDLDEKERQSFVDQSVAKVKRWGVLELLGGPQLNTSLAQLSGALRLKQLFGDWIEDAAPYDRTDMESLYESVLASLTGP